MFSENQSWFTMNRLFLSLTRMITWAYLCCGLAHLQSLREHKDCYLFCCITINMSPPTLHPQLTSAAASLSHLHLQPWVPKYIACVWVLRVQADDPWVLTKIHFFIPFIHLVYFLSTQAVNQAHAWPPTQIIPSIVPISYPATFMFSHDAWTVVDVTASLLMDQDGHAYNLHCTHQC